MTLNVTFDLPPALARRAARKGFLKPAGIGRLIEREVALDKAVPEFRRMVAAMRASADAPLTMDEIQAEVNACRAERRARASRR